MQTIFCRRERNSKKKRNPASVQIANAIIAAYKPESIVEMNEAIIFRQGSQDLDGRD